jgi:small subunit ribosomal protein S17
MSETEQKRTGRRRVVGVVTSTKMHKTIVVRSDRRVQHPMFKKYMERATTYKAHDEKGEAGVGDRVELMETRKISKTKNFRLVRIIAKARIPAETPEVAADADIAPAVRNPAPSPKRDGEEV